MPPHAPLTSATPLTQTAPIAIPTAFTLSLLLLSLSTHLYLRRPYPLTPHTRDLSTLSFYLAVFLGLADAGWVLYLISIGLGRDYTLLVAAAADDDDGAAVLGKLERGGRVAEALVVAVLGASKSSCACMIYHLTPFAGQKKAVVGLLGVVGAWSVCAVVVCAVGCVRLGLEEAAGRCVGYEARWIGISVVDMLLEAALVGASVYMVWGRAMSYRAKATVVGVFSCRVVNIALTLTRLLFQLLPAPTSAIYIARVQATTQLAVGYTVVACVIPYLRPLMQSYEGDRTGSASGSDATFVLSERSRSSKGSGSGSGSGEAVGGKGKGRAGGMELDDVSNFLEVKRVASREPVMSSVD